MIVIGLDQVKSIPIDAKLCYTGAHCGKSRPNGPRWGRVMQCHYEKFQWKHEGESASLNIPVYNILFTWV